MSSGKGQAALERKDIEGGILSILVSCPDWA